MYLILLCFAILKLRPSMSQFPEHMDLQKVGETTFNNEIYNILKPTTHVVSDYFTDYLLRRDNTKFPSKRLFIDDNGFRHYWSGFDKKTKSLRKTEIVSVVVEPVAKIVGKVENLTSEKNNETHNRAASKEAIAKESEKNNETKSAEKNEENKANTDNVSKESKQPVNLIKKAVARVDKDVKKKNRKRKIRRKKPSKDDAHLRELGKHKNLREPITRDVATATFFCPFFGIITMSAFID